MPWGAIVGSGWASGLSVYATAFLIGLAGRLDWTTTPEQLQSTRVLVMLGTLAAVEFVVDKIALLDSVSDTVHTVIRPFGAAWLAAIMAGDADWFSKPLAALASGGLALTAHGAKATTRAAANASPEPFSNVALSLFEDGMVAGMVALTLANPQLAGVVALLLAVLCLLVVWKLAGFVRRVLRRGHTPAPA